VFAASDRPTIIYSSNRKLLYSNLNENDVAYLASFSTSSLPDSLALVKGHALSLGTIDGKPRPFVFVLALSCRIHSHCDVGLVDSEHGM
jgi:hypothetical protein